MPARNTLIQLLALYTDPDSHNAQRHRLKIISENITHKALSTLSQKSATVVENGETTGKFGDSRTFLRQCEQALTRRPYKYLCRRV